jgi:hypothetical protein
VRRRRTVRPDRGRAWPVFVLFSRPRAFGTQPAEWEFVSVVNEPQAKKVAAMSPPAYAAALPLPSAAPVAVSAPLGEVVSLAGVATLDAAVLSSLVRTHGRVSRRGSKVRVVNATPEVSRMLRDLGLAWMLEGRPLPDLAPANEPMRFSA